MICYQSLIVAEKQEAEEYSRKRKTFFRNIIFLEEEIILEKKNILEDKICYEEEMPYFFCCQSHAVEFRLHFDPHVGLLAAKVYTINTQTQVNDNCCWGMGWW